MCVCDVAQGNFVIIMVAHLVSSSRMEERYEKKNEKRESYGAEKRLVLVKKIITVLSKKPHCLRTTYQHLSITCM